MCPVRYRCGRRGGWGGGGRHLLFGRCVEPSQDQIQCIGRILYISVNSIKMSHQAHQTIHEFHQNEPSSPSSKPSSLSNDPSSPTNDPSNPSSDPSSPSNEPSSPSNESIQN